MSGLPKGWVEASLEELAARGGLVTDGDWIESKSPSGKFGLLIRGLPPDGGA